MLVRVHFPSPGFMVADARVRFSVDGTEIGAGSMLGGVVCETDLEPGTHGLDAALDAGFIARSSHWTFEVPAEGERVDVHVSYSRISGSFGKNLDVRVGSFEGSPQAEGVENEGEPFADAPVRATWVIVATLVACFGLEQIVSIDPAAKLTPTVDTLLALGGLDVASTHAGQWFRLVSCTFLHADPVHLICNCVAIVMAGFLVERRLGWRWFSALYLLGGIGGSLVSLASNDGHTVSIGASGAAMALFGGGLFVAQTLPRAARFPTQFQLLRVLVPSLVPMFAQHEGHVDFGAHLGGTLAGLAMGALLFVGFLRAARLEHGIPAFRGSPLALACVAPFLFVLPWTAYEVRTVAYPLARAEADTRDALLPNDELQKGQPSAAQLATWLERYPEDPRVRLFQADAAEQTQDWPAVLAAIAGARATLPRFHKQFDANAMTAFDAAFAETTARVALLQRLVPSGELPQGTAEQVRDGWAERLDAWLVAYPDDPRVQQRAALRELQQNHLVATDEHVLQGLRTLPEFESVLATPADQRGWLEGIHVIVLHDLKRDAEVAAETARICSGAAGDTSRDMLVRAKLCP